MASTAEREIRDAVVARLRELVPSARIVHELNVAGQGSNRIDVAAIRPDGIVGVEIKSEKDTLKRLEEQWTVFSRCCHYVIVAAHEKHFAEYRDERWRDDVESDSDLNHPLFFGKYGQRRYVWRYPRPDDANKSRWGASRPWQFSFAADVVPRRPLSNVDMLQMLWASELREECGRHRIAANSRATCPWMIREMAMLMTGREVRDAVCRQLRARSFAEADAPIYELTKAKSEVST